MLIILVATLWIAAPSFATPGGTDRWIDTQMAELRQGIQGRQLTPEQDAMARAIFEEASGYINTPRESTFALWVSTESMRGNSFLVGAIVQVLWPHKVHVRHEIDDYGRDAVMTKSFGHLGAILILDDLMYASISEFQLRNIRQKLATLVDEEHYFGAVIVIDAKDLLRTHGRDLARGFQVLDLVKVIRDCQRSLVVEEHGDVVTAS